MVKYIIVLFLLTNHLFAQQKSDSLRKIIQKQIPKTIPYLQNLEDLAWLYKYDLDSLEKYTKIIFEQSQQINYAIGEAGAYLLWANYYYKVANYEESLNFCNKALYIYKKNKSLKGEARCLHQIAAVYTEQGKYPQTLELLQKSLRINEQLKDSMGIAQNYNLIGGNYINQKNEEKALLFFQKALQSYQAIGNQQGMAVMYNNLAMLSSEQKNYEKAIQYFNLCLEITKKIGKKLGTEHIYNGLGYIYYQKQEYDTALQYYTKSFEMGHISNNRLNITYNYLGYSQVYQAKKDTKKALFYAEKGIKLAQEIGSIKLISDFSKIIYEIYKTEKNHEKALFYHEWHKKIDDSLFNTEREKAINSLEIRADLEKKDLLIAQEKYEKEQQKLINYWTFAVLFLVICLLIFMLRAYQKDKKATQVIFNQKQAIFESHNRLQQSNQKLEETLEQLKKTQAHLVQTEKLSSLQLIMATISHEINNPINYVQAGAEVLDEQLRMIGYFLSQFDKLEKTELKKLYKELELDILQEDIMSLSNDIKIGAKKTIEIVQTLKSFIRLDEEGIKEVDIVKNLENVLVILRNRFLGKITIQTDFRADIPKIACDIAKINQLFLALLLNAYEASPDKGTIKIRLFQDEQYVVLSISDEGKGISPEIQEHIFEPFVSTKNQASGLGLHLAKQIVEEHEGKISFETSPNGTSFYVFLPKN